MHTPSPSAPNSGKFLSSNGERKPRLGRDMHWPNPTVSSGTARPLSVLSHSVCWEPKGPGREVGTGQGDRGLLLLGNWLLAQGRLPSLTWGQALSESCLAPLSPLPLRSVLGSWQALKGKEGQAGRGPEVDGSRSH